MTPLKFSSTRTAIHPSSRSVPISPLSNHVSLTAYVSPFPLRRGMSFTLKSPFVANLALSS
jgi:hypothetical protein